MDGKLQRTMTIRGRLLDKYLSVNRICCFDFSKFSVCVFLYAHVCECVSIIDHKNAALFFARRDKNSPPAP